MVREAKQSHKSEDIDIIRYIRHCVPGHDETHIFYERIKNVVENGWVC